MCASSAARLVDFPHHNLAFPTQSPVLYALRSPPLHHRLHPLFSFSHSALCRAHSHPHTPTHPPATTRTHTRFTRSSSPSLFSLLSSSVPKVSLLRSTSVFPPPRSPLAHAHLGKTVSALVPPRPSPTTLLLPAQPSSHPPTHLLSLADLCLGLCPPTHCARTRLLLLASSFTGTPSRVHHLPPLPFPSRQAPPT